MLEVMMMVVMMMMMTFFLVMVAQRIGERPLHHTPLAGGHVLEAALELLCQRLPRGSAVGWRGHGGRSPKIYTESKVQNLY